MLKLAKTSLLAMAVMATSAVSSDILATVNGKNITKQDAQTLVSASSPQANYMQLADAEKKMVLDRLIEKVLFTELAAKEGIDKKPEFQRNMEKIKDELLLNMWMKIQMDNALVSDSEAKTFYEKNADKFIEEGTMTARHILVETEKAGQEIIDELKSLKGKALETKFIELAKAKSTGPSAKDGGNLGTFTKGQMVPEFGKAASELKDGEITKKPVKTQFGYHVIYLEKKTESQPVPYENVKDRIILLLKQQQFAAKIKEMAKELTSKAKIVYMTQETNTTK
jgi:peptidyl-prolyl cis-trans isomerase C